MLAKTWSRIGWRNLGRNRRRTLLTAAGLAFGYAAVVVLAGLMDGLVVEMIENGTGLVSGQVQLHSDEYLPDKSIYETIGGSAGVDVGELLRRTVADPGVRAATPRVYGGGLVSSGEATTASVLVGIDPRTEPEVTRLMSAIVRGRAPEAGEYEILIGAEMARQLEAEPGDELIIVAPAADGSLGNDLYIVSGVFESRLPELDGAYAMLPLGVLQATLALEPGRIHEVAVATIRPWEAPQIAERLAVQLSAVGAALELKPWTELLPELVDYAQLSASFNWLILVFVFGMAIFGVANTMLMATFERRREFAVMMALGTTPLSIMFIVVAEALALGAASLLVGAILSAPVLLWWHNAPPDLSWLYGEFTMAGALVRPVLRVEYSQSMIIQGAFALLLTAILAALYPAARAARVPPADALAAE